MRIGVSAGPAVAGNVGAKERFEYTVIGDPVNEAARLCELARERSGRLLASDRWQRRANAGDAHARGRHVDCRAVPVKTEAIGKSYPPVEYEVGKEKIGEYARAVGEENPVYFERAAAKDAGFRDVVAPPMFAVVYSWGSVAQPAVDPEVDLNFAMLVHGGQEFVWGEPVCSGDLISTVASVKDISERGGMGFYVFETVSTNQDGQEVVRGTWTNIVRGVS